MKKSYLVPFLTVLSIPCVDLLTASAEENADNLFELPQDWWN